MITHLTGISAPVTPWKRVWCCRGLANSNPYPYPSIPVTTLSWCYPYPCHTLPRTPTGIGGGVESIAQSKQSSIFTSIFTRDMIGQPLRFQVIKKGMRSKNTWMHNLSLLLKVTGTFLNILCMQNHPVCNVCQFIYQTKISFITIQMMMLMRSWIEH